MPTTCRTCGQTKWRGDICNNPDCDKARSPGYRLTSKIQTPHTMMYQHGFHEPVVMRQESTMNTQPTQPAEAPANTDTLLTSYVRTIAPGREWFYAMEQERELSLAHTQRWWQQAHNENNLHHQRFPGYCLVCIGGVES